MTTSNQVERLLISALGVVGLVGLAATYHLDTPRCVLLARLAQPPS